MSVHRSKMRLARISKIQWVLAFIWMVGCAEPQKNQPAPSQQQSPPKTGISVQTLPPSGNHVSLFVRFNASAESSDFIDQHLMQGLGLPTPSHFQYHVTLLTLLADAVTHSEQSRQNALQTMQSEIERYFNQANLPPPIDFEIERTHGFPGNFRFITLVTTPVPNQTISGIQNSLYQFTLRTLQARGFQDVLELDRNSDPQNYAVHLTVYKTPYLGPNLTQAEFNSVTQQIDRRIVTLRNQGQLQPVQLNSLVISY